MGPIHMTGVTEKEIRNRAIEHFYAECPSRERSKAFSEEEEAMIEYIIFEIKTRIAAKNKKQEIYVQDMPPVYKLYD